MEYAGRADLETTLRYLRPAAASERIAEVSEINALLLRKLPTQIAVPDGVKAVCFS
jgi:hypothetical protein